MAKRIQVGGRIECKEVGGIVTGAAEILDDAKGKKQSVINGETEDELLRLDQSKQDNLTFDNAPTEGSNNPVKSGGVYAADKALSDAIEAILLLIPSAASALNKLVDTSMMNSSISTATATFRGTYNVVTDLSLTVDATHEQIAAALGNAISTADNNDYVFVQIPVSEESTDIRRTERYKFNGTAWGYEYDLNTSGFTAAQWAAINSGITLALVGKLIGLPTSSELQALLGQKQNTLTFDNVPTAGSANPVKSGGVHTAINDEKTAREQLANTVTGIDGRVENIEKVIPTGAADNNKLVANSSMEAYVTSIIEAITASFTIATADGHINFTLTQTNGRVASLTLTSSDIASAQALTALTGRVSTAEGNITTLGVRVSTNETDIANLQQLYNNLQQSKPVPVTALPSTGQQQGVIYRLAGTTSYSDYMWNGSTWVLMATYNNAIDPRPIKASQNLVTSGGVFDNIGALDVSELNATENPHTLAQYADLSAALAAIPTAYRKGGMSIKFVQSSDNKYVQYRCIADDFTTNVKEWRKQIVIEDVDLAKSDVVIDMVANQNNIDISTRITEFVWGNYVDPNGTLIPLESACCTDFISIQNGANKLIIVTNCAASASICFYAADKATVVKHREYASRPITGTPKYIIDIPANAEYVRISNWLGGESWNLRELLSPMAAIGFCLNAVNINDIKQGGTNRYGDYVPSNGKIIKVSLDNTIQDDKIDSGRLYAIIVGDGTHTCEELPINIVQYDDTDIISGINDLYKSADINDFSIQNTYINPHGDPTPYANVSSTDYIEIPNGYLYAYLGVCMFVSTSVCFYDSNKVKIATFQSVFNQKWVDIPLSAKYYRACSLMVKNSYAEGLQKPLILLSNIGEKESVKDLSQRIVELYASYNKYWMRQRINSDSFSGYGYVNKSDGQVVEASIGSGYSYTPLIEIDSIYSNIMCLYLNAIASISIAYYDSNEDFIGSDLNYGRKVTGISDFTLNIPFNAKYIRFSCSINDHSTDGNKVYQIKYPYVILCEDALGLSNNEELDKIKANYQFKEIDFSGAQQGFYERNTGNLETDYSGGMRYLDKVDIELYNKIWITLSSYASGCVIAEFDQDQNFIKSNINEVKSLSGLSTPKIITLNSRTRFIGISSLSIGQNTHAVREYQSESYYDYLNKRVVLFRDNDTVQEYSDYTPKKFVVDESKFVNPHSYIGQDGSFNNWSDACKTTDFINISAYNTINIKRLAAVASISLAFYSDADEASYLYTLYANQISTTSGERKYEIQQGASYVRISNLFGDIVPSTYTIYGVKPYIEFYNEEVAAAVIAKSPIVYDKSFFGDKNFALFDDFDYSQILCYGQSFADGGMSEPGGSTEVVENTYMLGSNTRATTGSLNQLAVNGVREFPVIGCVNALAKMCNRTRSHKFIASTGGGNGRCIAAMSEGTSYFNEMVTMFGNIKNAVDAENKTVGLAAIFFLQGESDYSPNAVDAEIYTNDKDEYKAKLLKLKNDLQNLAVTTYGQSYKPLFFVYQTSWAWIRSDSYTGSDNVTCPISMAQFELAQENDDVILISPCYFMTMYNNNHPSINGYRWTGEMAAKAIIQSLNMGIRYSNTKIEKVSYIKDKVFVDCYCPVLPLQIRTLETSANTNYGFWIREDGVEVTINDVAVNGSQIILTLAKELDANKTHEISYAGRYRSGRGNICDSDKWISTLNYIDDTNDHTIVQRPKNPDGTNIFSQKYPMFNYLGVYYGTF